jgi:predicted dehydrogenase
MVRALILGAGAAGERHGRALRALGDRCALAGVYDPDPEAARALAQALALPVVEQLEPALESSDAAVVAGTLDQRPALARRALERGLDVLVEPPLAPTADLAHGLLSAIVRSPRRPVAMVAFDEHFHPTVREVRALVAGQRLLSVHVERLDPAVVGPTPEHDVVHDLMQQDLQFVLTLSGETIAATQAAGRRVRRNGPVDHAQALLVLEDDVVASLVVSRAGAARARRIDVVTQQSRIAADLDAGTIEAVRTVGSALRRHESTVQRIQVPVEDATLAQAEAFLRYVQRRTSPEVGIGMAIACQEAAMAILKRIELVAHRPAARRGPQAA